MVTIALDRGPSVEITQLESVTPDSEGTIAQERVALPAFDGAVFFSADRRGPISGWPADANRELPWVVRESFSELLRDDSRLNRAVAAPSRLGLACLLSLSGGGYTALLTTPGEGALSVLFIEESGDLAVRIVTLGSAEYSGEAPLLAHATATTPAGAFRAAWQAALAHAAVKSHTGWRWTKAYSVPFEHLGWCSWEHFKKEIDAEVLTRAIRDLDASPLPVRWVLIDDGHQTRDDRTLKSLSPDPRTFPDGFNPLLDMRSDADDRSVRWMGLWHSFQGLWDTVHPENDLGALNDYLAELPSGGYLPRGDQEAATRFYDALIGSAAAFDFVKIDVQAANLRWYRGTENAVAASARNSLALERAVARDIPHGMINCMAHNALCVFSTESSAVTRCSIDYHLNDADSIASHIVQSYTNSLWLGWSVWPDHDMFHSCDREAGRMMAVSKALSGAPIYLSDAPVDIDIEVARPLALEDGRLLRPLAPAVPLPECTVFDALNDESRPYSVVAPLANRCVAVAAYNLVQRGSHRVSGTLDSGVYRFAAMMMQDDAAWELPDEGLIAYDWYGRRATRLEGPRRDGSQARSPSGGVSTYEIDLGFLEDALILIAPVAHGWAVIGREDKYLGPAAVTRVDARESELALSLAEAGPVVIWSAEGRITCEETACEDLGDGLFRLALDVGARDRSIRVRRE